MTKQCGPSKLRENQTQGQPKLAVQALGFHTLILQIARVEPNKVKNRPVCFRKSRPRPHQESQKFSSCLQSLENPYPAASNPPGVYMR
jgi:hypothetical protein